MGNIFTTLKPPLFDQKGIDATIDDAINQQLWIATVNVWFIQKSPEPSIIYQQRSKAKKWAPGKLDVLVAGKVDKGEELIEAIKREALEELNLEIEEEDLTFIGRNLHVGVTNTGFAYSVPHIYLAENNHNLEDFKMIDGEVEAIYSIKISDLIMLFEKKIQNISINGLDLDKNPIRIEIDETFFPENWDNYHYKIARIAKDFLSGKKNILY